MNPRLLAVSVGLPKNIKWRGETVYTGIWKEAVSNRRKVRRLNIDGDGQGDLVGHGGEQRAVMVYQMDSYHYWEHVLGRKDFTFGQFGENFTVEGLPDNEVCIGDRYRIGTALFEVTQPRVTCYRVGIRMDEPAMASLLVAHHRPGFYFRVLEEGEVGAGDEIQKVADGPGKVSVTEIDALLYLPGHPASQLERALRIPALSPGWKMSLEAMKTQDAESKPIGGNAGLTAAVTVPPAWPGFQPVRISQVDRESRGVVSLWLDAQDGSPLPAAEPGQFIVAKLQIQPGSAPVLRNYSLSSTPGTGRYRISVKQEIHGAASTFLHRQVAAGSTLEISAPRGSFTLQPGSEPIVLMSAGIGATPVLAMLHALAAEATPREVWWIYGARNHSEHPFAREAHGLVEKLAHGRSYVAYSRPRPEDRLHQDYDRAGHISIGLLEQMRVPKNAEFYLCGPPAFLRDLTAGLGSWGASSRIHTEVFGPLEALTPGIAKRSRPPAHLPAGPAGPGPMITFIRSGITVPWRPEFGSLLELAEACDVPARWSCRTGVCHTCECALINGKVTYRPDPLEPPAEGNLLTCCSTPITEVEIDL